MLEEFALLVSWWSSLPWQPCSEVATPSLMSLSNSCLDQLCTLCLYPWSSSRTLSSAKIALFSLYTLGCRKLLYPLLPLRRESAQQSHCKLPYSNYSALYSSLVLYEISRLNFVPDKLHKPNTEQHGWGGDFQLVQETPWSQTAIAGKFHRLFDQ